MNNQTNKETQQPTTAASLNKQVYQSPMLRVYGAVHQFTQGTGKNAQDASVGKQR